MTNNFEFNRIGSEANIPQLGRVVRRELTMFRLELPSMYGPNGINDFLIKEERSKVLSDSRIILDDLYGAYGLLPDQTFTVVRAYSNGEIGLHVENFTTAEIGFVEDSVYGRRENPDISILLGAAGYVITKGYPPEKSPEDPPVPYRFEVTAYPVIGGEMPYQYLD